MVEQQWGLQPLVPTGKSKPLNFGSLLFRTILKSTKFCSSLNCFSFSSSSDCTDCFFKVVSASTPNLCAGLSSASFRASGLETFRVGLQLRGPFDDERRGL